MKPIARLFLSLVLASTFLPASVRAQLIFERTVMLPPAEVDLLDATSATHLENARRFLAEKQWDEAIDALRRAMEGDAARYLRVAEGAQTPEGFERLIPIREHCQWRLLSLASEAPAALGVYRGLADPLAEQWLKEATENRDERLLVRLVREVLATRFGDEALLRLGDSALERGEHAAARGWYERIGHSFVLPSDRRTPQPAGHYPDSDLSPALVRSRLVLASILEGSSRRAESELATFRRLHPDDEGELAGRSGKLAELLAAQLAQSQAWPPPRRPTDWPTFAGNPARHGQAATEIDPRGRSAWSVPLPRLASDRDWVGAGRLRPADDMKGLLSYFPAVAGDTVLLRVDARGKSFISAHDVKSGEGLWQVDVPRAPGQMPAAEPEDGPWEVSDAHAGLLRHAGVARYTLTVHGHKLFARVGSPVTAQASRRLDRVLSGSQGYLVGFDLATQGKPLEGFPIRPESNEWSFEGTPLCDGGKLYVAMRRIEQGRCQFFVACFELQTTGGQAPPDDGQEQSTGRMLWRTKICSAGTLSGGDADEVSHLLLSLDSGTLFLNTNHGVIAALDAADGLVQWLCKYPRVPFRSGDPDRSDDPFFRDLTPCLVARELIICAPADSDRLFALERTSGRLAWATPPGTAADAVHLLGATGDHLLASGNYLYWLDLRTGQVATQFPQRQTAGAEEAAPSPRGLGRGILAGDRVYWPTRESIFVFRQTPRAIGAGFTPDGVAEIPLIPRGATGGNLVIASGMLFIATGDKLYAFDAGQNPP